MFKILILIFLISCNLSKKLEKNKQIREETKKKERNKDLKKQDIKSNKIIKNDFDRACEAIINNNDVELTEIIKNNNSVLVMRYLEGDKEGRSLLMEALNLESSDYKKDLSKVIEILISESSDLNALDKNGYSVLHYAVFNEKYVQKILARKNIDVNTQVNNLKKTPLMKAIEKGSYASVLILLETEKINLELKDTYERNILHFLATGIFESEILDKAFEVSNDDEKAQFTKNIIEEHKKIFNFLKKSSKFNFKEAIEAKDLTGKTASEVFDKLVTAKLEKEGKNIEIPNSKKEALGRATMNVVNTFKYWMNIKFGLEALFNDKF